MSSSVNPGNHRKRNDELRARFASARFANSIAIMCGLCVLSCAVDPLTSDVARWRITWQYTVDVLCSDASDREVASRTRFTGNATFRVERSADDVRTLIPIYDTEATVGTAVLTINGNCDVAAHSNAVLVSKPSEGGTLQLSGNVIDSTKGLDLVRMRMTGRVVPGIVRFTMKAGGDTVEVTVIDSLDIPMRFVYTANGATMDSTFYLGGREARHWITAKMNYIE